MHQSSGTKKVAHTYRFSPAAKLLVLVSPAAASRSIRLDKARQYCNQRVCSKLTWPLCELELTAGVYLVLPEASRDSTRGSSPGKGFIGQCGNLRNGLLALTEVGVNP